MMNKIGTHNSATGESGYGFLSWIGTPFARCQGKTIDEQYKSGCRYFDIRIKYSKKRGWICAHGLWQCKRNFLDILDQLEDYGDCYVMITYEGEAPEDFLDIIETWVKVYTGIKFTSINTKKPVWKCLKTYNSVPVVSKFKNLDGSSWHTYLPIPWLWKKIYYNNPEFNEEYYTLVDFL